MCFIEVKTTTKICVSYLNSPHDTPMQEFRVKFATLTNAFTPNGGVRHCDELTNSKGDSCKCFTRINICTCLLHSPHDTLMKDLG
jgi:hypothetical protein